MMKRVISVLFILLNVATAGVILPKEAYATYENPIVVSMGDSYASGEGIAPFYGQDSDYKYQNQDWIAHRSQESWAGRLVLTIDNAELMLKTDRAVPSSDGTWGSGTFTDGYHFSYDNWSDGSWFFVAVSGAQTKHVRSQEQKVTVEAKGELHTYSAFMAPQIEVFDYINSVYGEGSVDYVTLSIGGNDLGFTNIVSTAATTSQWTDPYALYWQLKQAEHKLETETIYDIADTYREIWDAAGQQAYIIVTGYPLLFHGDTQAILLSQYEMDLINDTELILEEYLSGLVDYLQEEFDGHLRYVSLIEPFKKHGAYTKDAYINNIIFGAEAEEVGSGFPVSSSSMHPTKEGARVYAEEVQKVINEIEPIRAAEHAAEVETQRQAAALSAIDEFEARFARIEQEHDSDSRLKYGTMNEMASASYDYTMNLKELLSDILDWLYVQPGCDVNYVSSSQDTWQTELDAALDVYESEMEATSYSGNSYAMNINSEAAIRRVHRINELLSYARSITAGQEFAGFTTLGTGLYARSNEDYYDDTSYEEPEYDPSQFEPAPLGGEDWARTWEPVNGPFVGWTFTLNSGGSASIVTSENVTISGSWEQASDGTQRVILYGSDGSVFRMTRVQAEVFITQDGVAGSSEALIG